MILVDLPEDSPFTVVVRWLIALAVLNVVFSIVNVYLNTSAIKILIRVHKVKRQTRRLLTFIKEWVHLGKDAREDTQRSAARVEEKTAQLQAAVAEAPQRVMDKLTEAVTASPPAGATSIPAVVIPIPGAAGTEGPNPPPAAPGVTPEQLMQALTSSGVKRREQMFPPPSGPPPAPAG